MVFAKLNSFGTKLFKFIVRKLKMTKDTRQPSGYRPIALDGGYGWVVVLGSFLIHVFADGFVYSFGVIAESLVQEFNGSNAEVSTILSLLTGLMLAAGPVASAVCNKIGCRWTTIIGAIIASAGCAASYYADGMWYLVGSVGIIMGTGFGLMYCPAIIIVTMYFEKKRSLATGITVCGAGVGTSVFSVVVSFLIVNFGWRNVFLIYAGIVLLCIPCGMLYRPIEFEPIYDDEEMVEKSKKLSKVVEESEDSTSEHKKLKSAFSHPAVNDDDAEVEEGNLQRVQSLSEGIAKPRSNTITSNSGYLSVKDVFYQGSVTELREYQKDAEHFRSISSVHSHQSHTTKDKVPIKSIKEEDEENLDSQATSSSVMTNIWDTVTKILDISLFADPVYVLFAVSNFLTSIGFNAPPMFMPMMGEKVLKLSKESAAQTVSAYGIANIMGRIVFGLVCDRKFPFKYGKDTARNRLWIYNWTLMIIGIASTFVFLMMNQYVFKGYCFCFGFLISSYVCLTSVVLVDMVGVDKLTSAFGLLLLVQGIATFVGPPIAGALYDFTQSYNWTFAFCGICLFISGIMLFIVPYIRKPGQKDIRLENGKDNQAKALLH